MDDEIGVMAVLFDVDLADDHDIRAASQTAEATDEGLGGRAAIALVRHHDQRDRRIEA